MSPRQAPRTSGRGFDLSQIRVDYGNRSWHMPFHITESGLSGEAGQAKLGGGRGGVGRPARIGERLGAGGYGSDRGPVVTFRGCLEFRDSIFSLPANGEDGARSEAPSADLPVFEFSVSGLLPARESPVCLHSEKRQCRHHFSPLWKTRTAPLDAVLSVIFPRGNEGAKVIRGHARPGR